MKLTTLLPSLALGAIAWLPGSLAAAASISSNIDTQVTESDTGPGSGSGGDTEMNARFNASSVNEFIVVRFDLAGVDKSTITSASIDLTYVRDGSNNQKDQRIFGVNSGVAGLNTFDETIVFDTTPGLATDNDVATQSVIDADTTYIGDFKNPTDPGAGNVGTIDQNLLDTTSFNDPTENSIVGYLQSLGMGDQAVFLIGGAGASSGQFRITTTEGGSAPVLNYSTGVIPEPSTLVLAGLGVVALGLRRRR